MKSKDGESGRKYLEDIHYSIVEYAGSNITHWSFLGKEESPINVDRLCGTLFLIADKDPLKAKRHEELRATLGDRFYLLKCREIENLLTRDVLLQIIRQFEKDPEDTNIKTNFKEEDYAQTPLGGFIDDRILKRKTRSRRCGRHRNAYAETKGGTIRDKRKFCKMACAQINSLEDMSKEAKAIAKRIYEFIVACNK